MSRLPSRLLGTAGAVNGDSLVYNSTTDEWGPGSARTTRSINAQTGTAYTLALSDAAKFVTLTNAATITVTVPTNASVAFPVGTVIDFAQLGTGRVTFAPASGVTLNASPGVKIAAQYGVAALIKLATDTWLAMGRLTS